MLITSKRFKGETYWCRECDEDINEGEINMLTWECDNCNNKVLIDIELENDNRLVRLPAKEVTRNDDVFDQHTREFYSLRGITSENGKYRLGVAGFGMVKIDEDDFVNCRWIGQGLTY